jgi:uncharacterized protein (TIGR00369 family)
MTDISIDDFSALVREGLPWVAQLDIAIERLERGAARVRLKFNEGINRPGGTIAGPAIMALADLTMYALVLSYDRTLKMAVTSNLNINFLRKPGPADLVAEGHVLKLGRRLAVLEVAICSDGEPDPVAHVTGTYALPTRPQGEGDTAGS